VPLREGIAATPGLPFRNGATATLHICFPNNVAGTLRVPSPTTLSRDNKSGKAGQVQFSADGACRGPRALLSLSDALRRARCPLATTVAG
jgi:hypothetical protein